MLEVRDPRVSSVTITQVDLSDDLREATVSFVPLGGMDEAERIAELEAGLRAAAGFLQRKLGTSLRLRSTPRLRFRFDVGLGNLARVHDVIEGIKKDEVD